MKAISYVRIFSLHCCEATRFCSRLISVAYVTSLGCLYQKPSFGCRHRQKFRTRDTTRGYARQPEDRSGRRSVQRFVWAFKKNSLKYAELKRPYLCETCTEFASKDIFENFVSSSFFLCRNHFGQWVFCGASRFDLPVSAMAYEPVMSLNQSTVDIR